MVAEFWNMVDGLSPWLSNWGPGPRGGGTVFWHYMKYRNLPYVKLTSMLQITATSLNWILRCLDTELQRW